LRFIVQQEGSSWLVIDTSTGSTVFRSQSQTQAQELADRYNTEDPQPGLEQIWLHAKAISEVELDRILKKGFEPYAVYQGHIYLKKKIIR